MKIITTVGTSVFSNLSDTLPDTFDIYKGLINESHEDWDDYSGSWNSEVEKIKKAVTELIKKGDEGFSAEIQSIIKISKEVKENLDIYLVATDTINSRLAAELIEEWLTQHTDCNVYFNPKKDVIEGLQVINRIDFSQKGVPNLFKRLLEISGGYWGNIALNITGGYKALIPIMMVISQVRGVPAYYIFQEEKDIKPSLIKIPILPLQFDESPFEKHYESFLKISTDCIAKSDLDSGFLNENKDLLMEEEGLVIMNEFTQILWEEHLHKWFYYFATESVEKEIQKQLDVQRILSNKFWSTEQRKSQSERKQDHIVFDDGRNSNRIYYFEENGLPYIYKTFEDHDAHEKYIPTKINPQKVIENSKLYRIQKNN